MPDDIFDYMNKRFKKMFKEWSLFGEEFDDMFKDVDETFEIRSPKTRFSDTDGKSKSYSISYNYHTGMKEPEIRVSGDASDEDVEKFLNGIQKRFGNQLIGLSDSKPKMLAMGPVRTTRHLIWTLSTKRIIYLLFSKCLEFPKKTLKSI